VLVSGGWGAAHGLPPKARAHWSGALLATIWPPRSVSVNPTPAISHSGWYPWASASLASVICMIASQAHDTEVTPWSLALEMMFDAEVAMVAMSIE
jgi:hypothetical protein